MKAFLKNIILIGNGNEKRILEFTQGLNIVTGDSKTGKSALIEIVDFCLFAKRSTVPVGKVTDFTRLFCCVFKCGMKQIIIGRERNDPNKCYFTVEYSDDFDAKFLIDSAYFLAIKPRSRLEVQQDFEEHLGLSVGSTVLPDDNINGINKGKVSIRNATSLFFQHQNLIANKHSLFYRFDNFIKVSAVIDQFPIFMGWVDNRYYRLKKRADQLDKELKLMEKEERKVKLNAHEQKERLLVPIKQYYDALNLIFTESDSSLSRIKEIATNLPEVPMNAEQNVDFKRQLGILEKKKSEELNILYNLNHLIDLIEANELESSEYGFNINELVEVSRGDVAVGVKVNCPVCSSAVESVDARVNAIHNSRMSLLTEFSKVGNYKNDSSKSLNAKLLERDKQKLKISEVENDIRRLKKLFNVKNNFEVRDVLNQIKGRIETVLEIFIDNQHEIKSQDIVMVKAELDICLKDLRGYGLEHKFSDANALMNKTMNELKNKLDFEEDLRNGEMKFKTEDFSFSYYFNKQEIRLSEMGSGANWLACHLAVFLAILKLISKSNSVIPAMLFLDQPSQVYFPRVIRRFSSSNKDELLGEEHLDENIKQVINIFNVIKEFLDELEADINIGFKPQVIVLEHADEPEFDDFIRYRWSTNGDKLI